MTLWSRIAAALSSLAAGEGLSAVFDHLRAGQGMSGPEKSVGFTIAVIALGAKMAKADGTVTRDEVSAFRRVFTIAESDAANAARVFNLARQDVAGFDAYAHKVAALFRPEGMPLCSDDRNVLIDLLEGLFHIAMADGSYHPAENEYLARVATIFGLDDRCFRALRARFVEGAVRDPYDVLGLPPGASLDQARAAWKQAVRDSHPDVMIARGIPAEAVQLATRRLIAINAAWKDLQDRQAA